MGDTQEHYKAAWTAVSNTLLGQEVRFSGMNLQSLRKFSDVNSDNDNDLWILATDFVSYKNNA